MHRGGYGFVQTAEGEYFIPKKNMHGAFPDDVVEIAPVKRSDTRRKAAGANAHRRVARVVRVLERAHDQIVGYFHRAEPFGVVVPADPLIEHDIFTMLADNPHIPDGAIVRVAITTFPDRNTAAITGAIAALQTNITKEFCDARERDMQADIDRKAEVITQLRGQIDNANQTAAITGYINSLVSPIAKEVDDIKCKMPNTVPVTFPNLAAVNMTPYVSGGYYQGGFNGYYGGGVPGFGNGLVF